MGRRQSQCILALSAALFALAGCQKTPTRKKGPKIIEAESGDVAKAISQALSEHAGSGREHTIVYVGATWCEPCQRFIKAVYEGALDRELRDVSFIKFDADRDEEGLGAAGYEGEMIPRFVVPRSDGRASIYRFEGSIKGDGAVGDLLPKLQKLIANSPQP